MEVIEDAFKFMSQDTHQKLHMYQMSLEARYGDPRVYAMQQEEMAQQDAEIQHTQSKTRERALADTYNRSRRAARARHTARRTSRDIPPPSAEPVRQTHPPAPARRRVQLAPAEPPAPVNAR